MFSTKSLNKQHSYVKMTKNYGRTPTLFLWHYSIKERIVGRGYLLKTHLSNKRGGWNKREGGAKGAKSINVEVGITVEVGIFLKNQ